MPPPPRPPRPPPRPPPAVLTGTVLALTSAPCSMSTPATPGCFSATAHISAVCPRAGSFALASPPCASNSFITSTLPLRAAERTGLSRPAPGLAPAFSSRSTIAGLALRQASPSGVTPPSSTASTLAPARMSRSAMATSLRCAAQCSAVAPSGWVALTSIFCSISRRTASASTRRTASIRRVSGAAPSRTRARYRISAISTTLRTVHEPIVVLGSNSSPATTPTEAREAAGRSRRRTSRPASPACSAG